MADEPKNVKFVVARAFAHLAAIAFLGILTQPLSAQIAVSPVTIEFNDMADSPVTRTLSVANQGAVARSVDIHFMDFDQAEDGSHQFYEFGTHERTCSGRLHADVAAVVIPAESSRPVGVTMNPDNHSCYAMAFVQVNSLRTDGGPRLNQRVGVKVYGTSSEHTPEGSVDDLSLDESDLRLTVTNSGERILRASGRVELRHEDGELVDTLRIRGWSVLPTSTRTRVFDLPEDLPSGNYLAVAVLDYGGPVRIGRRAELTIR